MTSYSYHRPRSLSEALELKSGIPGSVFISGGTDLLVQMKKRRTRPPSALISLRNIESLRTIEAGTTLRIGGGALLEDIVRHPTVVDRFPALIQAIRVLGSKQIRNVATLGGNLCNASPAADTAPPLLVYEAQVELTSASGTRLLPIESFFVGPGKTQMRPEEVLSAIVVEAPGEHARSAFFRKGRVQMDLAIASVAVSLETSGDSIRRVRVAAGAVAPTPRRLPEVEAILEGSSASTELLEDARQQAKASVLPIDDLRSTAEYRRELVGVFVKRAVEGLVAGGHHFVD